MGTFFKVILGTFAFTAAVVFTGCGNVMPASTAPVATRFPASSTNLLTSQGFSGSGALSSGCTGTNNVLAVSNRYYDGTGNYEACSQTNDQYTVILHGKAHSSDNVCVYAGETDSSGNTRVLRDGYGNLLSQCVKITDPTPTVYFGGVVFNTFLIVESPDQNLMNQCILSGSDAGCPWYSFGKFRN